MNIHRPPNHYGDADALAAAVARGLTRQRTVYAPMGAGVRRRVSAVLFLLSPMGKASDRPARGGGRVGDGVHLILNKRSAAVRQAGDLCCPGGGVTPVLDRVLGRCLELPGSPLTRWPGWWTWRRRQPVQARRLALLFATALREGFEEMRLNPLGLRLLGPMAVERLVVFRREIYPFVGWVGRQRRFTPNWEVAGVVHLPLAELLDPANYACLHYRLSARGSQLPAGSAGQMPCYLHRSGPGGRSEVLWGATFRIAMRFLEMTFGFRPPPVERLPVVTREFDDSYINGKKWPPGRRGAAG